MVVATVKVVVVYLATVYEEPNAREATEKKKFSKNREQLRQVEQILKQRKGRVGSALMVKTLL